MNGSEELQQGVMMSDQSTRRATARMGLFFAALVVVQLFHSVEHVAQVAQRYLFHSATPEGFLGAWLDLEWVHFTYNVSLGVLLAIVFIGYKMYESRWRDITPVGWWALVAAVVVQLGVHIPEHVARIYQYLAHGWDPAPGILGHTAIQGTGPFDLLLLHFWYNAIVTVPLVVALVCYWRGCFRAAFRAVPAATSALLVEAR